MSEVHRLDDATVERIAAGEVVTDPAAVVRELVENALDAGAETIQIAVAGDGTERIRVTDDGRGMSEADAGLAVEDHATSKIGDAGDLRDAATLGFRGEALSSIARYADLSVTTNDGGPRGVQVTVADGEKRVEAAGHASGTTVEVTDLFGATPARREALAAPDREFARLSTAVSGYALAHPGVGFRLAHDGRSVLSTPGSGDPADALLGVYDREAAAQSARVDGSHGTDPDDTTVEVSGVVCYPAVTRATNEHVHVAVNGRPLPDATVRAAVVDAYGTLLPDGRSPVAAVGVSVPPAAVDQNVHPAKRSVAFRDADAVADAVRAAAEDALGGADLSRTAEFEFDLAAAGEADASAFGDAAVVGTFRDLYVLCAAGDDLLVVDQHAAHERINYERLRDAVGDGVESAPLDPPATVSLSPAASALAEGRRGALADCGFDVTVEGGVCRVRAVPTPLGETAAPETIRDVLDTFLGAESDAAFDTDDPREELLKTAACHPSIRAGDALDDETAQRLVERLGTCERTYACPHGRPTVLTIDEATLARGFERPDTRFGH